jgi:pimeloyl-ACP methyl ester carboxylesterase
MNRKIIILISLSFALSATAQTYSESKRCSGKVKANGISIAYEIFGAENKEAILLICGTGSQLTDWPIALCEQLAQNGYRVIRFDNRDVGLSSKLDSLGAPDWAAILPKIKTCDTSALQYTVNDMAMDAVGLLDALKIEKAHIVGASMGGAIAQMIAVNFPERTLSLTCVAASSGDPNLPAGNPKVLTVMALPPPLTDNIDERTRYLFNIYKALDSKTYPTPDSVLMTIAQSNVKRSWYPAGTARQAAAILIADNCDRREQLKKIHVPVVIIHGDADPVVNIQAGKEIAETVKDAKLIIVPGMSHALPPSLIDKIVDGILIAAKSKKS